MDTKEILQKQIPFVGILNEDSATSSSCTSCSNCDKYLFQFPNMLDTVSISWFRFEVFSTLSPMSILHF